MGVEVEIEGEDGSKLALGVGEAEETVLGRGCGFHTKDRTVSRRHVSFQLNSGSDSDSESEEARVSFEVIGRNPFWVWSTANDGGALRVFRRFDKGHLEFGDRFSLSGKTPFWFHFNKHPTHNYGVAAAAAAAAEPHTESENENEGPGSRAGLDIYQIDLSQFDPVKEFGFLVMGHEFDRYPKGMIRNVKDWEWFLEEPSKDSVEEEDEAKERRKMRRKRKKGKDNDDEEWGGESEDDKDLVAKIRKGKRPGYSTRAKDREGTNRGTEGSSASSKRKKATNVNNTVEEKEEEDDDDDDDETLGGFIVDDEEDDQQGHGEETDEEEEEEFEDDDED